MPWVRNAWVGYFAGVRAKLPPGLSLWWLVLLARSGAVPWVKNAAVSRFDRRKGNSG